METPVWTVAQAKAKLSEVHRARAKARSAGHYTQWSANRRCRVGRRMGAQDRRNGSLADFFCGLAFTGFRSESQPLKRQVA